MEKEIMCGNNAPVNLDTVNNIRQFVLEYNNKEDVLFLHSKPTTDAMSFDWDGEFWIRFNPNNGEIVGIEIEDFERCFLERHLELKQVWSSGKSRTYRRKVDIHRDDFIQRLLDLFLSIFSCHPTQIEMKLVRA